MRKMTRYLALLLLLALHAPASAEETVFAYGTVPHVLRPGKDYLFEITVPRLDLVTLTMVGEDGETRYTVQEYVAVDAGTNRLAWDGMRTDRTVLPPGQYTLQAKLASAPDHVIETDVRVGAPYPMITGMASDLSQIEAGAATVSFHCSDPGVLTVQLLAHETGTLLPFETVQVLSGVNEIQWRGMFGGERVPAGEYALVLSLRTERGDVSSARQVAIEVLPDPAATPTPTPEPTATPVPTPEPTPEPPVLSPPYTDATDGSFWGMTPGETDHAVIWEILTRPITVYDGGLEAKPKVHAYMMENPDGTGERVAQLHAQSQALRVIGEVNEHGYILVEAFSNYDETYYPQTDAARETAFDVKQGYVPAEHLKTVEVRQDIGFVVDKLTQRMYMYMDGEPVTEFLIATGMITGDKYYNETIPGEYITISHTGGFVTGNMYCDMAIRINGGILLHEVPHKVRADGSKDYSAFEGYLGLKQSHGCIRIQRKKTPEGYSHRWLWENLDKKGGYKVIIWDDLGRVDQPETWQENPKEAQQLAAEWAEKAERLAAQEAENEVRAEEET